MDENKQLEEILEDLKLLLKQDEILGEDFDSFLEKIKSDTVKNYLLSLRGHSKPEAALVDSFFSSNSSFAKYLFKNKFPEVGGEGFIDYIIDAGREEIGLEIKPLFEAEFERGKSGEIFKKIKKIKLNWESHKDQIRKYLGRKGEFVVFTNLEEWYFFSRSYSLDEDCNFFASALLFEFLDDFKQLENLWQYLDKKEDLSVKEPLDKKFFNSLKSWVQELRKVNFNTDEKRKNELIINLINKFIFIQSLDRFWVIQSKYIENKWSNIEREWQAKNKLRILKKFLEEINEYFYEMYDTELFKDSGNGKNILSFIGHDEKNIELFYEKLKIVLGIDYNTTATSWVRGIIQFNFRRIDEDILGKAYETFLAEIRKEQGIYYTPKYITQYIVDNTAGKQYDELLRKIRNNLENENFKECEKLIKKFVSIKVLDPACGSGSFLIKALKTIWNKYKELNNLLNEKDKKYTNFKGTLSRPKIDENNSRKISELKSILDYKDERNLISKIIIRHIHGNDLDKNALEVAKLNLWLEAIKLAPKEFQYDKLPAETNHILPDLEMNLRNGDSLVGLQEDKTIEFLWKEYKEKLKMMSGLRTKYLKDPTNEDVINELNLIKNELKEKTNQKFKEYLKENDLNEEIFEKTKPFHWALEFWYVYFADDGNVKEKEDKGFDVVVGNPPYIDSEEMTNKIPIQRQYISKSKLYKSASGNWDIYCVFTELAINLLNQNGYFGYIIPNKILAAEYAISIQKILYNYKIVEIRDYSRVNVFEGAAVYPIVLTVKKEIPNNNLINVEIYDHREENIYKTYTNMFEQSLLEKLPEGIWSPILSPNFEILKNILKRTSFLEDFGFDIHGACSVSEAYRIANLMKEFTDVEKDIKVLKFVNTGTIDRYIDLWGIIKTTYIKKRYLQPVIPLEEFKKQFEKRFQESISEKVIIAGMTKQLECFYDKGCFNAGKSTVVILNKEPYLILLSATINSRIIDFVYRIFYEALSLSGGFLRVGPPQISRLPFPNEISSQLRKNIEQDVNKIATLKKLHNKFKEIWAEYSRKYRNNYKSLNEIILDDKKEIQKGNFNTVWISEASIYPDGKNVIIGKEFDDFVIAGEGENLIKIFGISGLNEELILELKAKDKYFRDIIYFGLLELLDSSVRIKNLKDIFEKTEISVIQPNIWENSCNLVKGSTKKFEDWLKQQKYEIKDIDIIKIDNQIKDIDNQINANVFRLYGLNKNEVETVLDSLGVLKSIKSDILFKFEKLD